MAMLNKILDHLTPKFDNDRRQVIKLAGLSALTMCLGYRCTLLHTKPNVPYKGILSDNFERLKIHNRPLYSELMKLPEMQDGISSQESMALEELTNSYFADPQTFDLMFEAMHNVGKPDVRKYNSLLQALFWLFEDGKSDEAKDVIKGYELEDLLDLAWWSKLDSYSQKGRWLQSESRKLFDSCTDKSLKKQILKYSQDNLQFGKGLAVQYTIQVSREHPEKFGYVFDDEKFAVIRAKNKQRWSDFDTVVDRLNSPETIEYWTRKNISYKFYCGARFGIRKVFDKYKANCVDLARFVSYLLDRSGYTSGMLDVHAGRYDHTIVYFRENGKYCLIQKTGVIPCYDNLSDIPFVIISDH